MINYKPEVLAFWDKYKDVETEEEWGLLVDELVKFKEPLCIELVVRSIDGITKRYEEKMRQKGGSVPC